MRLASLSLIPGIAIGAEHLPVRNANHMFNAVHSSMRQWDSSIHHNGMSFFIAAVPSDTQIYHGTSFEEPVSGMEWLAFEPEHALAFAHPPRRPRPPRPRTAPDVENHRDSATIRQSRSPRWQIHESWSQNTSAYDSERAWESARGTDGQKPLGLAGAFEPNPQLGGYLHTYRTKHPLSLLYIDGMAAAKCDKGTLDSTDAVLLGLDPKSVETWDWERADALCNLTREEWGGRIDGFLRMEMGFEIILCDFAAHLTVDRIARTAARSRDGPDALGPDMSYYRAVALRFDGIGGNRVAIDYDNFVTAFDYDDVDLFNGDILPRLDKVSNETISRIHRDVTQLVMSHPIPAHDAIVTATTNWQAVADMVVNRYARRLESLAAASSLDRLQLDAELLLRPYIDYSSRNSSMEVSRCADQYLTTSEPLPRSAEAIRAVATSICATLVDTLASTDLDASKSSIAKLMAYLQWPIWKRCRQCGVDEECYIPMWPSGRKQDYESPQCQIRIPIPGPGESYWR